MVDRLSMERASYEAEIATLKGEIERLNAEIKRLKHEMADAILKMDMKPNK